MTVMRAENLPEMFRPPSSSTQPTWPLPGPLAELVQEATADPTRPASASNCSSAVAKSQTLLFSDLSSR